MKKKKTQSKGASAKPQRQKVVNQITIEYLKRRSKELDAMAQSIAFEACSGRAPDLQDAVKAVRAQAMMCEELINYMKGTN